MIYEILSYEIYGRNSEVVIITREDGSTESFPVDESNHRYQQFLVEID